MLNRIDIMGRLTGDPELRRTQSGTAVASFTIAVERDYKPEGGEKETDFFDVVAWRKTKGRMAVIDGRLQTRKWTDKNGGNRVAVEIIADSVYFGDSKKSVPDGENEPVELEYDDGDLPF